MVAPSGDQAGAGRGGVNHVGPWGIIVVDIAMGGRCTVEVATGDGRPAPRLCFFSLELSYCDV